MEQRLELAAGHILLTVLLVSLGGLLVSRRAAWRPQGPHRLLVVARSRSQLLGLWVLICSGILGVTTGLWALLSLLLPDPAVPAAVFTTEAILLDLATQRVQINVLR